MPPRYRVEVHASVVKTLRKMDPPVARRLYAAVHALADNPRPAAATALVGGDGQMRLRVGDYRVIYEIEDDRLLVLVLHLAHRREVYRGGRW